jgi:putative membrane protein
MNMQWSNIINLLMYMGIAIPLLWVGVYIFRHTTPYDEFEIIAGGGDVSDAGHVDAAMAVAYDLGGKVLGVAIVLSSAIFHAANPLESAIWGMIGIVFEVLVFCLFRLIAPIKVTEEIRKGNISVGIFSASMSIGSGLIMAALIS